MPTPFSTPHSAPVPLPALYLYPLNESFAPKHISLINNQRVKIGRQTNAKTVPAERNGYFDSKVLSRQHAEVWEEGGKIFIKDVKSSNGTFINGERLSPEGLESDPFELKSDDIVEFGIDIVGEDNKTIIHHKVAARVMCVFTEQDAQAAARAEAAQNPPAYGTVTGQAPGGGAFFSNAQQQGANGNAAQQRRMSMQPGMLNMGSISNMRPPGKSGLTFDHILSRLQGELQKSRDTGAELHQLSGAMNEIHETLGGNPPANLPPYPSTLPPVMPPQTQQQQEAALQQQQQQQQQQQASSVPDSASTLHELQSQLRETQISLANYVEKIRALEGRLAEHDAIKREVSSMRELMEERKREMELFRRQSGSPAQPRHEDSHDDEEQEEQYMSDEDDARSVSTVTSHHLDRVEEEDEEQLAVEDEDDARRRRREEFDRPRTPEPTMGMPEDDDEQEQTHHRQIEVRSRSPSPPPPSAPAPGLPSAVPEDFSERLATLSHRLESALAFSRTLEAQHSVAQSTISTLESKVTALETMVQETQAQVQLQNEATQQLAEVVKNVELPTQSPQIAEEERAREREFLTNMVSEWKKSMEDQWSSAQEEWTEERERLRLAREEWETRVRSVEDGFGSAVSKVEAGIATLTAMQHSQPNGSAKLNHSGGLVTPPSPRSLSAESSRPRQRRKRASSSRGRSRSRSRSPSPGASLEAHPGPSTSSVSGGEEGLRSYPNSQTRRRSTWTMDDSSDSETPSALDANEQSSKDGSSSGSNAQGMPFPITPESSVLNQPIIKPGDAHATAAEPRGKPPHKELPQFNTLSTVVGVLVLSVAAAAVIWRVKPET